MYGFQHAEKLFAKARDGGIGRDDMDAVAQWPLDSVSLLFAAADQVRNLFRSNKVDPCSLLNIKSGGCTEDCAFCAQSAHNSSAISEHGLVDAATIAGQCRDAAARGVSFCVVSSGRRLTGEEVSLVCAALKGCPGDKHASLGILSSADFDLLRDAGVSCYNHNIETSRSYFGSIVTTHQYDDRIATVRSAKAAGMKVCCGGIFGMGESWQDRIEMCLELRGLNVDTVPLNFFNPIEGTRLPAPAEPPLELLKIVSLFRLAMPGKSIKVCGGREYHLGTLQPLIFFAGANGYVTGGYLTTPGAGYDADERLRTGLGLHKELG